MFMSSSRLEKKMVSHFKLQFILDAWKRYKLIRYALKKVSGADLNWFPFLGKCFFYISDGKGFFGPSEVRTSPRVGITSRLAKFDAY